MQEISNTVMSLLINSVACNDNMKLMAQLADEGADFNNQDYRGRTPLHIATLNGNFEVVKFLLDQRVNIDQVDNSGTSALYYACTCK
jgi:lysophospholipase